MAPETSIIIRTFNEQKYLPLLLTALAEQAYRDFEIIVVDSGSIDHTRDLASKHTHRIVDIKSHDFTFGYSLNAGIKVSSGRFLVLVSAHTKPSDANWLSALIEPLRDDQTAMSYGRQIGWETSKFGEALDFYRTFGAKPKEMKPPNFFANNANSAVRKDLWEEHPFDEHLPGLEDVEFAKHWMEKGYKTIYEPKATLHHVHEETWPQVRRRYYREAIAARVIGIQGRRHIPREIATDTYRFFSDLFHLSFKQPAEVSRRSVWAGLKEISLFRYHRNIGTVTGLLSSETISTPEARKHMFFENAGRAVVIQGKKHAQLETLSIPDVKPGEVVIRVAYVGVCATDLEIYDGELGYYKNGLAKLPIIPGHEFSGEVVTVGQNIADITVGDRVVVECIQSCGDCKECARGNEIGCDQRKEVGVLGLNGGYADYTVVPGKFVHKLQDNADLLKAALCEPIAVSLKGLRRLSKATSGGKIQKYAVVGAGSIGHICARILEAQGQDVTVFDILPQRLSFFDGSKIQTTDDFNLLTNHDIIIEATGHSEALDHVLHKSPAGANILLLGLPYAHRSYSFEQLVAYDKTVIGSVGSRSEDFQEAIHLAPALDLSGYFKCILPLEDFQNGWEIARRREHLKVMLDINGSDAA